MNKNTPGDREASIRLSNIRGEDGGKRERSTKGLVCTHAYKPNQWSPTTGGWGHEWGGVWDGNGGMRTNI